MKPIQEQIDVCAKYNLEATTPEPMVALALEGLGMMPIYGCRKKLKEGENISWYFHCGEHSDNEYFYSPIHTEHLDSLLPLIIPYLYLPPDTWFIIDDKGYEDVWREETRD